MNEKVKHVLRDRPRDGHTCHWPGGCSVEVPPSMLMCRKHWMMVPKHLQAAIWRAYRPGQEDDKRPSKQWLEAFGAIEDWFAQRRPQPGSEA